MFKLSTSKLRVAGCKALNTQHQKLKPVKGSQYDREKTFDYNYSLH